MQRSLLKEKLFWLVQKTLTKKNIEVRIFFYQDQHLFFTTLSSK